MTHTAEQERAAIVAYMREAIATGYPVPTRKVDRCEHGKFGWEDCIACYDIALGAALVAVQHGAHLTNHQKTPEGE